MVIYCAKDALEFRFQGGQVKCMTDKGGIQFRSSWAASGQARIGRKKAGVRENDHFTWQFRREDAVKCLFPSKRTGTGNAGLSVSNSNRRDVNKGEVVVRPTGEAEPYVRPR